MQFKLLNLFSLNISLFYLNILKKNNPMFAMLRHELCFQLNIKMKTRSKFSLYNIYCLTIRIFFYYEESLNIFGIIYH